MFDVEIVVKVNLGSPSAAASDRRFPVTTALAQIRLAEDDSHRRWRVSGRHDPRFPGTGAHWLRYKRNPQSPGNIILLNKHGHEWAELENFPVAPRMDSKGTAFIGNIDYPPCKYTHNKKWFGDWAVSFQGKQRNLPLFDPSEGYISQAIHGCTTDTGFRFDTSSGIGGSGGAVVGVGGGRLNLVLKRKESNDARRWDLTITYAGLGLMTPGGGISASTEDTPSGAFSSVLAAPGIKLPFPPSEFAGSVVFFDVGGGAGVGRGPSGGVGGSTTTFLFLGGVYNEGMIPDFTTAKALLQTWGLAGAGGRSTTLISGGAAGLLYGGVCSVKPR